MSSTSHVLHLSIWMAGKHSRMLMDIAGETVNTLSAGQFVHDVRRGMTAPVGRAPRRR